MNTIDKLIEYGLNKSEALVYLDVISHPDSSAFAIFKRLKLPKTSIYNILENLQERRLIESWKKNNILHFSAGSPKRLLFEVKTKEELLQTLIPDLINLSSNHIESDSVKMYEGEEGLKIVMHDELEYCAKNNINSMLAAATDSFSSTIPKFLDKYIKEREKANIFVKMLIPKVGLVSDELKTNNFRETRFLPKNFMLPGTINIYGDRVDLFSIRDGKINSIVINSKTYTDLLRNFFLLVWDNTGEK